MGANTFKDEHIQKTMGGGIKIEVTKVEEGLKIEVWKNGRNDPYTVEPALATIVKWAMVGVK